jgi:uncharacterized protein YdaT
MRIKHSNIVKAVLEEMYSMPTYDPRIKVIYNTLTLDRKESMMYELDFNNDYAVYNYQELPSVIQTKVNDYIDGLDIKENDEEQSLQVKLFDQDILVTFPSSTELDVAVDGLKDPENYNEYIKQFRTLDPGLDKFIKGQIEPPGNPAQRKALLNKRREELGDPNFEWIRNTSDAQKILIKKYFETKPNRSMVIFEPNKETNSILIPLSKNILTKVNLEKILKTVLGKIGLTKYKITTQKTPKDITSENLIKELVSNIISEKKMTPAQKKKRGEIYDALVKKGMSSKKAGPIATSQAMKEGFPDLNKDGKTTYADVLIGRGVKSNNEDIDVGHQDDEPYMLKADAYQILKNAVELYKMLAKYEQMGKEIDFPDWWQEKIHLAKDYLSKSTQYLEFEKKEPTLDTMLEEDEEKKNKRYIPQTFTFSKDVKNAFGENFKYFGGIMYADPLVKTALGQLTRGRKTYDTTKGYSDLTTLMDEKMPQQIRMSFKKGLENSKPVQVGNKKMLPIDLSITKDEEGNYIIKNPYLDNIVNKIKEAIIRPGNTGIKQSTIKATFSEEDDFGDDTKFGTLTLEKTPELNSIGSEFIVQYNSNEDKIIAAEFYDEGSDIFKIFLEKRKIPYKIISPTQHGGSEFNWFSIDNISKYFDITTKE